MSLTDPLSAASQPPETYRRSIDLIVHIAEASPLYSEFSDDEWIAYFSTVPTDRRSKEIAKRRIGIAVRTAKSKDLCLYCWMPSPICCCGLVQNISTDVATDCVPVFILHAEEFLRRSNSGHIAAMLFDAPLLVLDIDELSTAVDRFHELPFSGLGSDEASSPARFPVLLYPSDAECTMKLDDVVLQHRQMEMKPKPVLVIGLLDGTWNQANGINRRLRVEIQRCIVHIPSTYESLFAPIREQTRSTGVSTLEATAMAVVSVLEASGASGRAVQVRETCRNTMKLFVDIVRLQKHLPLVFPEISMSYASKLRASLNSYTAVRHAALVRNRGDRKRPEQPLTEKARTLADHSEDVERPNYVPVSEYCYCCDVFVGASRMNQHVRGTKHRSAYEKNPSMEPSNVARFATRGVLLNSSDRNSTLTSS